MRPKTDSLKILVFMLLTINCNSRDIRHVTNYIRITENNEILLIILSEFNIRENIKKKTKTKKNTHLS